MKHILLFLALLSPLAFGKHIAINCATTNITTSYTTSSPGIAMSSLQSVNHFSIVNGASVRICVDTGSNSTSTAPSSGGADEHCVPATYGFAWDFVTINSVIYVRADGSTCSSGVVDIDAW